MPKNNIINFKIEQEVKAEFNKTCKNNFTNPSHELRLFVRKYININKQSKKTPTI